MIAKKFKHFFSIGILLGLGACGTTYSVKPVVTKTDALSVADISKPGIYYYLPRTDIFIEFVATQKSVEYGPYYSSGVDTIAENSPITFEKFFRENIKNCGIQISGPDANGDYLVTGGNPNTYIADHSANSARSSTPYSDFSIRSSAVPDPNQLYRLNTEAETFSSFTHTIEMNANGIIKTASTTTKDGQSKFILATTKGLADLVAQAAFAQNGTRRSCVDFRNDLIENFQEKKRLLEVTQAKQDYIEESRNTETDVVKMGVAAYDQRIAALKKNSVSFAKFEKSEKAKPYVVQVRLTKIDVAPTADLDHCGTTNADGCFEIVLYEPKYEPKDEKEKKLVSLAPGELQKTLIRTKNSAIENKVAQMKVRVESLNPTGFSYTRPTTAPSEGYPYRLPSRYRVSLIEGSNVLAETIIPIAQLGEMVWLPSKFDGASATVAPSFDPNTGVLTKVTLSAEPIGDTSVSDYLAIAQSFDATREAARKAEQEAATKAEEKEARSETDALLAEKEYLEALKAVRELRETLGLPAE